MAKSAEIDPYAPCEPTVVHSVGKYLKLPNFSYRNEVNTAIAKPGLIIAGVCRRLKPNSTHIVAAFVYDDGIEYEKRLLITVVNPVTSRIVASFTRILLEDAVTVVTNTSLRLDATEYKFSRTKRAFGLLANTFVSRCGFDGGQEDEFTLYVVERNVIRPVLSQYMEVWSRNGHACHGEPPKEIRTKVSLTVRRSASRGFADLTLKAKRSDGKRPLSVKVQYDGAQYDLNKWGAAFEKYLRFE
jgi:hypothetical protein